MLAVKLMSLIATLQSKPTWAAPLQPDNVPSIHPFTGPDPPQVATPPHGSPNQWTPPTTSDRVNSPATHSIGQFWTGWQNIQKIFAFGDSYTTTGFDLTMAQPSPDLPLGNPAYPGLTSSNGPNYIDFLTTTYNDSFIETYNLGFGGATVDSDIVPCYDPAVPDFRAQVNNEFFPYYVDEPTAGWNSGNSLFISFFGINDITNSYSAQNASVNGDILTVYAGLVDLLYNAGARNFLFLNVAPVNLSPGTVELGPSPEALEATDITNFNDGIAALASNASTYPDATAFLFDTNAIFSQVLQSPTSHPQTAQYLNTTTYCTAYEDGTTAEDTFDPSCGVPVNQYFWLNTLHPTYPMHDAMAQAIAAQLSAGQVV